MKYSAINIQGNILTSEILEKIRIEDFRYQKPIDFGLDPKTAIRDEVSLAWSVATSHWKAFQQKRENLRDSETGTTETRRLWLIPLLQLLGYEISVANAEIINEKSYAISHRATNLEGFPIHVVGINQSLDKRAETGGTRLSPHALGQEYLNNHEHLYALVSNGKNLRLLRDATLLSRLSFVEFNLEQIMEENLYAEFALMFRLLHSSRMPQKIEEGPNCFLEFYHVEALASGSRIRERLSKAVEVSLKDLANGLLIHPANKELRESILEKKISAKDFYLHNLRIIYRILFLLVIEDRNLIYSEKIDEELTRKRDFYYKFYSLRRLTNLAENLIYVDPKKTDLWSSLLTTFSLFEYKEFGDKLGIAPLGSGIFHPNSLGVIRHQHLDNETLLKVLRYLVSFENENKQRVKVNYADLDVEEFGSVYEGLLEYEPVFEEILGNPVFTFIKGDERSSSGSHYTPEELVKPLIDHSLQYQIEEKLKEEDPEKGLLSLTVCDVACGSGHILLSAARRIGFELAKVRSGEDQPTPSLLRKAIRDVINHCIYGVDLNPLAVELCKVALWLEAHQPGEPLNFLDHHIKCGNAIVGLAHFEELKNGIATEAFKTLSGDDKEVAATFRKANAEQIKTKGQLSLHDLTNVEADIKNIQEVFLKFLGMAEHTPQQIEVKTKAYESLTSGKKWFRIKQLADLQVAQFFIPKTKENREKLTTEAKYQNYLNSGAQIQDRGASMAIAGEKRFFHWFLEFPQVFGKGGFDCVLGNPPFLGGQKLTGTFGNDFAEYIRFNYSPIGSVDLVTYFFRRVFEIIKIGGFQSLISTNTIAQGSAREGGLEVISNNNGVINHAVRSMRWPGLAAVEVSLITIYKGKWCDKFVLDLKEVEQISTYLDDQVFLGNPISLKSNKDKSFQGSIILGKGFLLNPNEAKLLIVKSPKNKDVLYPYLSGSDLNNSPTQTASRWIINFFDWEEKKAKKYEDCYKIIERDVKPDRIRWKKDKDGNEIIGTHALRKPLPEKWWIYAEKRPKLYSIISKLEKVIVITRVSKYVNVGYVDSHQVFMDKVVVLAYEEMAYLAVLQSSLYDIWAWKNSSTLGAAGINFSPNECFETYVFPNNILSLNHLGENYHLFREKLMLNLNLGLTKTYNQFHNNELVVKLEPLGSKEFQKKYGKETWNLYKHLDVDKNGNIAYKDAVLLIEKLRVIHREMDEAVLEVYGWHIATERWGEAINLRHDFYEVDYLPENDRVRYTIHPDARKEVLKRFLLLNHEHYEREIKKGLHKKKDVEAYFKQKGKELPEEISKHFKRKKANKPKPTKKTNQVKEPTANYALDFGNVVVSKISKVQIKDTANKQLEYHLTPKAVQGEFTGEFKQIDSDSALAQAMLGKSIGENFEFGKMEYEIVKIKN